MTDPERVADIVVSLNKRKPIVCSFLGGTAVSNPRRYLKEHGVVDFETPERGIKALSRLQNYVERKSVQKVFEQKPAPLPSTKKMLASKKQLTLEESFDLLKEAGIQTPETIFFSKKEEIDYSKLRFPVALKTATGLAHKTDFGLVKANIRNQAELDELIDSMLAKLTEMGLKPRLALQEMIVGQEVLVSAITNEFGKVITYGLGGIFVEIMKDFSQKIVPINDSDIDEMLAEVKGTKVLLGARTKMKYDVMALRQVLKDLSFLVTSYPNIKEIEFNPVIINEKGCFAVDAVVTLI